MITICLQLKCYADHAPQTKALLFTMFAGSCAFNFALKKYTHMLDVTYNSIFTNYNVCIEVNTELYIL